MHYDFWTRGCDGASALPCAVCHCSCYTWSLLDCEFNSLKRWTHSNPPPPSPNRSWLTILAGSITDIYKLTILNANNTDPFNILMVQDSLLGPYRYMDSALFNTSLFCIYRVMLGKSFTFYINFFMDPYQFFDLQYLELNLVWSQMSVFYIILLINNIR